MSRLVLHAPEEAGAFYLSAWAEGDVFVPRRDAKSIVFVRRGDEHDGCSWQGTERLTRLSPTVYAYEYAEKILSCKPDARPFRKTPRTGIVTVEPWSGPATATAQSGVQPPGDLWNTASNDVEGGCDTVAILDDAAEALADAQEELADAQEELADATDEAPAALASDDDE